MRFTVRGFPCALVLGVLAAAGTPAQAQLRGSTAGVTPPPVSIVAPDDALALELNPAALAFLEAWSAVYLHAEAGSGAQLVGRGDAIHLATPLFFGLSIGATAQSVRPTEAADAADRGILGLGLAWAPAPLLGFGASLRYAGSSAPRVNGLVGVDLAIAFRPSRVLGFALLARDITAPLDMAGVAEPPPPSFLFATAFRPTGTRALTIEAAGAIDPDGRVGARGSVDVGLPYVGRAQAAVEVEDIASDDRDLRVIGGLAVDWGVLGVGGGVMAGEAFDGSVGWYATARMGGVVRDGVPTPSYVADVEVAGDLDARQLLRVVARLDRVLHDERAAGVLLRLRATDLGLAYAQELRLMIDALQAAGKPVVCHLDAANGGDYYACATASRVLLDPAGGIRLMGPSVDVLLLGDLVDRVGLRADFVRIGRFKSAPEQLTNSRSSEGAVLQRNELLDDVYARMVGDLSRDLGRPRTEIARIVDDGPYVTPEAVEARLVAGTADELVLDAELERAFGGAYPLRAEGPTEVRRHWGSSPRIGVVVVDGNIVDGRNVDIPLIDIHLSGGRSVAMAIDELAADPSVKAIVLRVDSPGGSALASDQIWRAIRRARRRKPVVASMGAVAASGGYYVACAADEIWADPSTVTGSIGIFYGKIDVAELASRIGVTIETMGRGAHAGAESLYRPFTPEERAMLADKIRIWYRLFLQRIAEGRDMEIDEIHALGQGRVWSGDAALRHRLVDRLGGFGAALARARELAEVPPDAEIVVVPFRPIGLLDYVLPRRREELGSSAGAAPSAISLPPELRSVAALATTLGHTGAGVPLAILPANVDVR